MRFVQNQSRVERAYIIHGCLLSRPSKHHCRRMEQIAAGCATLAISGTRSSIAKAPVWVVASCATSRSFRISTSREFPWRDFVNRHRIFIRMPREYPTLFVWPGEVFVWPRESPTLFVWPEADPCRLCNTSNVWKSKS